MATLGDVPSAGLPLPPISALTTSVSVGTSNSQVLTPNTARRYLLLVNDSANTIYIALGNNAGANFGIRINANGGWYEQTQGTGNIYQGAIYAYATGATSNLIVIEGT